MNELLKYLSDQHAKKAPEPDRIVELYVNGEYYTKGNEMDIMCMYYYLINDLMYEMMFTADQIRRAQEFKKGRLLPIVQDMTIFDADSKIVKEWKIQENQSL